MMRNTKSHDSPPADVSRGTPGCMPGTHKSRNSSINAFSSPLPTKISRSLTVHL